MLFTPWRVSTYTSSLQLVRVRWSSTTTRQKELQKFNILFCGSDSFSVAALDALLQAKDVQSSVHVLTSAKPKPVRQAKLAAKPPTSYKPSLKQFAEDRNLPTLNIPQHGLDNWRLPKPFHELAQSNVLVTASFGYILPDSFLHQFEASRRLNLHPSLLPKYRGAAPIQWTIANGETSTGVSVQRLVEKRRGIDGGEIVGSVGDIPVEGDETYWTLLPKVAEAGGKLLVDVLRQMQRGTDTYLVSQAPKITHRRARILWQKQSATEIERLHRAIGHQEAPHTALLIPPAPGPRGSSAIELSPVQFLDIRLNRLPGEPPDNVKPGWGYYVKGEPSSRLFVACAPEAGEDKVSWVEIMRVRKQSRKDMSIGDWWNGLPPRVRKQRNVRFA